ncbi:ATPase [Acidomonas methanolica]|nr:ATPase [Acidomonas methanolica]
MAALHPAGESVRRTGALPSSPQGGAVTVLLVGIDGGGTGTRLRVATPGGAPVASGTGGPANIATDPDQAWRSIADALAQTRAHLPRDAVLHVAAGLAGAEVHGARARFLTRRPADFATLIVETDAHTSCLGAHGGADGAIMAIGTGSIGYALLTRAGETLRRRVGGWGFPQGDEGSGAWIGRRAVAAMLQAHDGRIAPDALTRACWSRLAIEDDPPAWAVNRRPAEFARLAPLVLAADAEGSPQAAAILRDAAAEIDAQIAALCRPEGFADLPLCLLGGLGQVFVPRLSPESRRTLHAPRGNAVDGALLLARQGLEAGTQPGLRRLFSTDRQDSQPAGSP